MWACKCVNVPTRDCFGCIFSLAGGTNFYLAQGPSFLQLSMQVGSVLRLHEDWLGDGPVL